MDDWQDLMHGSAIREQEVTIAVVGKYIEHRDAYKSIYEALDHAGFAHSARVLVKRIEAEETRNAGARPALGGVDGILVPGGFGMRGVEGKGAGLPQFARERHSLFRHLPGNAVRGDRVRPQRAALAGPTAPNSWPTRRTR
jgi:CTP synthase